ncbi:hypothetical protein V1478_004828 [Vespula squamosa]|uniref:Uncharacterized protein n=1 Tax=Vespula squamosa TaxID=30214 RepID=A0ABD2BFP0_VESSQ
MSSPSLKYPCRGGTQASASSEGNFEVLLALVGGARTSGFRNRLGWRKRRMPIKRTSTVLKDPTAWWLSGCNTFSRNDSTACGLSGCNTFNRNVLQLATCMELIGVEVEGGCRRVNSSSSSNSSSRSSRSSKSSSRTCRASCENRLSAPSKYSLSDLRLRDNASMVMRLVDGWTKRGRDSILHSTLGYCAYCFMALKILKGSLIITMSRSIVRDEGSRGMERNAQGCYTLLVGTGTVLVFGTGTGAIAFENGVKDG